MNALTSRQQQVLEFIRQRLELESIAPSLREIAAHFGFRSMTAAADHVRALERKGALETHPRRARSLRIAAPRISRSRQIVDIPLYGAIPAGFPDNRRQEAQGSISIDLENLNLHPGPRTFALEVKGDSMIGRHILDGDIVVLEHGLTPRNGDIVAALIDNESTLKTLVLERGKSWLRAENPRYPQLIPAAELVIQGVMIALLRRRKNS